MTGKDTKFIIFAPPIELMMKYNVIALIVITLSVLSCSHGGEQRDPDSMRLGIVHPAKMISSIPDTTLRFSPADYQTMYFDTEGRILKKVNYAPDGSPLNYETCEYDDQHRLVSYDIYSMDGIYDGGFTFTYDGNMIATCTACIPGDEETAKWINKNDGKHIIQTEFYSEGELQYTSKDKYGKKGLVRDEETINSDGECIGKMHYEYIAEEIPTLIRGGNRDVQVEYNEKLLPVRSSGAAINSAGEVEWIVSKEDPVTYEYEYDDHGNWIVRSEYRGSRHRLTRLIRREIEYYQ